MLHLPFLLSAVTPGYVVTSEVWEGKSTPIIQYQIVSSEDVHTSSIIQMNSVVFRNIYVYISTYTLTTIINNKRGHKFEREVYERF